MNLFISNKFKYFIAVMEEGSVSRACERMHISRTPMSKAISDLEQALGLELFIRTKEGMTPSPFGTVLYNKIAPHYKDLQRIELSIHASENALMTKVICSKNIPKSVISHLKMSLIKKNISSEFYIMDSMTEEELSSELHFYDIVLLDKDFKNSYSTAESVDFDVCITSTPLACEKLISGGEIFIYHDFHDDACLTEVLRTNNVNLSKTVKIPETDLIEMMHRVNNNEAVIISSDMLLQALRFDNKSVLQKKVITKTLWFYSHWKSKKNREAMQLMTCAFRDLYTDTASVDGLPH